MAPSEKVAALRALRVPGLPRFRLADAADASAKDGYFIRHGEAEHNPPENNPLGVKWLWHSVMTRDSALTPAGVAQAPRAGSEGRPERHVLDGPGSLARDARLSNRLDEARCRRRLADLRKAAPDRAAAVESRLRARAAAPEQPVERRRASAYGQLQPKQLLVALALL